MKICAYCKESVKDDAIKCRYCHSMLGEETQVADDNRITYILDQDIIRFAKFAGAVLGIFGVVGLFLFGISTEETVDNFKEASDTLERNQIRLELIQQNLITQQNSLGQAENDLAAAQADIATHQADLVIQSQGLAGATNDLATAQSQIAGHQGRLKDQENNLLQATNDLATAQAQMAGNQEAMSQTVALLDDLKGELEVKVEQAERYLDIIVQQHDKALSLTNEQEQLLVARRSQNPEEFRDPNDDSKLWPVGKTITVSFLDGDSSIHSKVEEYAQEWTNYANIEFDFAETVNSDAEIRISFDPVGSWSYVGTDSLAIPEDRPTMNLSLRPISAEEEIAADVLHEFGHVLGMLHEEQNPNANIPWNEDAVNDFYAGPPYYWSEERTYHNILSSWEPDAFPLEKEFDSESIMIRLAVPNELTEGDFELTRQSTLSAIDKEIAALLYPEDES